MSPRPEQPVEIAGGLTVDQIDLRISSSEDNVREELTEVWAKQMEEHTKKVDERFDLHEQKDALRIEKQDLLINTRLTSQDQKLDVILAEVKAGRAQGDLWHTEDLAYRLTVEKRFDDQKPQLELIPTIATQQEDINTKFNLIQWLVLTCKGIVVTKDTIIDAAETGKKLHAAIASICSSILLLWAFFRQGGMLEGIKVYLHHHGH